MLIRQFPEKKEYLEYAEEANVIPVCREILADTETPVSLLSKIQKKRNGIFLFESVEGGERWGRYSFMGASAKSHVRVFKEFVEVEENGEKRNIPHDGDPLAVLRSLMKEFRPVVMNDLPRFWGGMVGYLTYEMVSFFEAIPNRLPDDTPIAHFIVPDSLMIFDNIRHTLFVMAITFPDKDGDASSAFDGALSRIDELMDIILESSENTTSLSGVKPPELRSVLSEEKYRELVSITKKYIREGDIIQAVISQPFVTSPAPDLWSLYRAQRYINPSPYMFFIDFQETALVGSSPETMVRLENGMATLRPIAGTRPRGANEQEDRALADELLKDEKERAEHLMLVDLGRNDLGRVSEIGSVQVTDLMFIERYSHVMHLVSNIRGDLKPEFDAWDLFRATFPAGTLSGAPKVRAMEIIAELEDTPRGPYGGAVGYISFNGNMDMAITIRTACIENDSMTVRAGAGLVADSDPERERIETENKARAIQRALELVNRG